MSLKESLVEAIYKDDKLTRSDKIKLTKLVLMKEETNLLEISKSLCSDCRKLYEMTGNANEYIKCLESKRK